MEKQPDSVVRAKLAEIFTAVLKRPIGPEDRVDRGQEKEWDSLRHVELVFVIEDAFGVTFPPEAAERLASLDAFEEAIGAMAGCLE